MSRGGLGCSSTPLAQAVSYINEASGSGPASPGFSKRDHFFSKYYAEHGTSRYFVGTVTCHRLWSSRDITKYGSTLYIGMDEVLAHHACTFENSELHFHLQ